MEKGFIHALNISNITNFRYHNALSNATMNAATFMPFVLEIVKALRCILT